MKKGTPKRRKLLPDSITRTLWTQKIKFEDTIGEEFILGIGHDVTQIKKSEDEKEELIEKLTSSNTELERFAYIASHDLQEPLRMVTNFTERLKAKCTDKMDDKAQQYMDFIVDGSTRMQALIDDLLEYSRVGHDLDQLETVDLNQTMRSVQQDLLATIDETKAEIIVHHLPTIKGHPVQKLSLLENLVANALKYRRDNQIPVIEIGSEDKGDHWLIWVKDNGIGMDPKYCEQIFETFKRLHTSNEYSGTGIGLSICKKIVTNRGGKIWAKSAAGEGSTFFFTLPKTTHT